MKKRCYTVLTACLAIAILFSSQATFVVRAEEEIVFVEDLLQDEEFVQSMNEFWIDHYGEEFMENLDQAHENDEALMSLFAEYEVQGPIYVQSYDVDSSAINEPVYPDFIGGIYYNDDGNMVVQMVTDAQLGNTELMNAVDNFIEEKDIIVEDVQFSYNEIKATMDALETLYFADDRPDTFENVDSIAEDTLNNRVEIRMRICNEEEIARFKETALNSPMIGFVQSSGPVEPRIAPRINFLGGAPNQMGGSIGYRARLNGADGFVTHGHNIKRGERVVINGHIYGEVVRRQFSGNVDAAFVQTTSRGIPSNSHSGGGAVSTTVRTYFRKGDAIAKIGNTSGKTTGVVTNTSVIANGVSGLVETDCYAWSGDSGGLVIGPNNTTAGIVHGSDPDGYDMVFCRADVINAKWGLVRY